MMKANRNFFMGCLSFKKGDLVKPEHIEQVGAAAFESVKNAGFIDEEVAAPAPAAEEAPADEPKKGKKK